LQAFTRRLAAELGHPAQINAYMTPASSRGFDPVCTAAAAQCARCEPFGGEFRRQGGGAGRLRVWNLARSLETRLTMVSCEELPDREAAMPGPDLPQAR
jgi:hypothetical protein